MPTTFPTQELGSVFKRGLKGESSVYLVLTGPNETRRVGAHIPLFWIETGRGEIFQGTGVADRLERYADYDPHGPYFMTEAQLAERALGYQAATREEERQRTEEFGAVVG